LDEAGFLQWLAEQHLDHRRHQRADLHAVLLGQLHPARRIEPPHEDGPGALVPVKADAEDRSP